VGDRISRSVRPPRILDCLPVSNCYCTQEAANAVCILPRRRRAQNRHRFPSKSTRTHQDPGFCWILGSKNLVIQESYPVGPPSAPWAPRGPRPSRRPAAACGCAARTASAAGTWCSCRGWSSARRRPVADGRRRRAVADGGGGGAAAPPPRPSSHFRLVAAAARRGPPHADGTCAWPCTCQQPHLTGPELGTGSGPAAPSTTSNSSADGSTYTTESRFTSHIRMLVTS